MYIKWKTESSVEMKEPECFIYEYEGEITGLNDDDDEIIIGKCKAMYIDVASAFQRGFVISDVFDEHSINLSQYYNHLFDLDRIFEDEANNAETLTCHPSELFTAQINKLFDEYIIAPNILIIDRVEILPEFRARKIGLNVISHIMTRFYHGAGIIVLKPFPLQFEAKNLDDEGKQWQESLQLDALTKDSKKAQKKLEKLYRSLGFKLLPKSPFMVYNVADGMPETPEIEV